MLPKKRLLLAASVNKGRDHAVSSSCTMQEAGSRGMRKILPYVLLGVVGLAIAGLLRQRQRPIPIPPTLTFLFENPLVEALRSELLVERLDSLRHAGTGCRLWSRAADHPRRESGRTDRGDRRPRQPACDARKARASAGGGKHNQRPHPGGWPRRGGIEREAFDRVVLAFVLGEVRNRRRQGASSTRHSSREDPL